MPGFDKAGPAGQGSLTGRGMGPCAGKGTAPRGRFGRGRGRGRGFGQPVSLEEEEKALKAELEEVRKAHKADKK